MQTTRFETLLSYLLWSSYMLIEIGFIKSNSKHVDVSYEKRKDTNNSRKHRHSDEFAEFEFATAIRFHESRDRTP